MKKAHQTDSVFQARLQKLIDHPERDKAEDDCRNFLRDYPRRAEAHFLMARALTENKRSREAFPYAEAAHKLAPQNAHYAFYLGHLYLDYHLYEFALPLLKLAAEMDRCMPQFQEGLGNCYYEIGMGEKAIPHLKSALALLPNGLHRIRCVTKLINVFQTSNQIAESRPYIDELLQGDEATRSLGALEDAHISKEGPESAVADRLRQYMAKPDVRPLRKVSMHLALGRLHENAKEYDAAFHQWVLARDINKQEGLKLRQHHELLDTIFEFYIPQLFSELAIHGHPSQAPVFIIGMPRSGTTLTEQVLASHPNSTGVGELDRFSPMDAAFRRDYPAELRLQRLAKNAAKGELRARAAEILKIFEVVSGTMKSRVVEKTPHNFRNVGYLALLFPNAKFIHCYRNPFDTFISSYQNNLGEGHGYAFDQVEYAKEFLFHVTLTDYWKSVLPDRIMTLHYENMATDPETWARKLVEFIGLPWSDECLKFHEKAKTVRTISTQQVRKPVNSDSVARWRRYEKHLGPITTTLQEAGFIYPNLGGT